MEIANAENFPSSKLITHRALRTCANILARLLATIFACALFPYPTRALVPSPKSWRYFSQTFFLYGQGPPSVHWIKRPFSRLRADNVSQLLVLLSYIYADSKVLLDVECRDSALRRLSVYSTSDEKKLASVVFLSHFLVFFLRKCIQFFSSFSYFCVALFAFDFVISFILLHKSVFL